MRNAWEIASSASTVLSILAMTMMFSPLNADAHEVAERAGTDDYLRDEAGWTDDQLQNGGANPDERQPFDFYTGEGTAFDPLGDVLSRVGTTSAISATYGDVERAVLSKNDDQQTWDLHVVLGGAVPQNPTYKVQLFFFADTDDNADNNAPENGTRGNMDAEFDIQHNEEAGWYTDFRWYNKDADFWAMNKETASTFEMKDNTIDLHIPYAEMSADVSPKWRVIMAVADGGASQLDAVPTVGFPPKLSDQQPAQQSSTNPAGSILTEQNVILALIAACGAAIAYALWNIRLKSR
jgi:hypothetical protein